MNLREKIRAIPDFPIPGIMFRDITPLLADAAALAESIEVMSRRWVGQGIELVAAMEARGFIFGAAIAKELGAGFVPVGGQLRLLIGEALGIVECEPQLVELFAIHER